jgi:hypothetical protein
MVAFVEFHGASRFAQIISKDRLKEWEPMENNNELAHSYSPWRSIDHNAVHWDPRLAGFQAIQIPIRRILFTLLNKI